MTAAEHDIRGGPKGARAPRFTCCHPPIQKLVHRSDVISEFPKCTKIQILRPDPTALHQTP